MSNTDLISGFEGKLKANPKSLVFARLADIYLKEGQIDQAIAVCTKGIRENPYYVTGHFILAKAYLQNSDNEHAEETLKKVLSHDRHHLKAHQLLGDLMVRMGWGNRAESHYQDILQIDPLVDGIREILSELASQSPAINVENEETDHFMEESFPKKTSTNADDAWMTQIREIIPDSSKDTSESSGDIETNFILEESEEDNSSLLQLEEISKNAPSLTDNEDVADSATDDLLFDSILEEDSDNEFTIEDDLKEDINSDLIQETEIPDNETLLQEMVDFTEESKSPIKDDLSADMFSLTNQSGADQEERELNVENTNRETNHSVEGNDDASFDDLINHMKDINSQSNITMNAPTYGVDKFDLSDEDEEKPPRRAAHPAHIEKEPKKTENNISDEDFFKAIKLEDFSQNSAELFDSDSNSESADSDLSNEDEKLPEIESIELDVKTEDTDPYKKPERQLSMVEEAAQLSKHLYDTDDSEEETNDKIKNSKQETPYPSANGNKKILTPTLGEIYIAQEQYDKALEIYEELLKTNPDSPLYQEKVDFLKKKSAGM